MVLFLTGVGCLCLIYFLGIALFAGHGTNFFCLWLVMGVGCLGLAFLMKKGIWQEHIPVLLRRVFWTGVGILAVLFCIAEGFIISGFQTTAPENVDALVVLGAQMKAEGPSRVLQYRLDAADKKQQHTDGTAAPSGCCCFLSAAKSENPGDRIGRTGFRRAYQRSTGDV